MNHPRPLDRRRFVRHSFESALSIGVGAALPNCFADAASVADSGQRVLVIVQLSGGNDGLNTVVPFRDDDYRAARPKLAIAAQDVLKVSEDLGLHPSLSGLDRLLTQGQATIIQNVGYENPNRSHFESMDIWHSCVRKDEPRGDGWVGRYLDAMDLKSGGDVPALHLGQEEQPLAVVSRNVTVPTVKRLDEFQIRGDDADALGRLLGRLPTEKPTDDADLLGFLQFSTRGAVQASKRVTKAASDYRSKIAYPDSAIGEKFRTVAQLIDAGLQTRVYYLQLDGFDTHAQQSETHAILLRQWGDAVAAFVEDMNQHGHGERVCVMTFSEFGRRVAENASDGTDHGAAGPMFLCGGGLRTGLYGRDPDLTDLSQGDLRHSIDFRSVYASVLEDWLGAEPDPILRGRFERLPLFRPA